MANRCGENSPALFEKLTEILIHPYLSPSGNIISCAAHAKSVLAKAEKRIWYQGTGSSTRHHWLAFTASQQISPTDFMLFASHCHGVRAILHPRRADAHSAATAYLPGRASVTAFCNADAFLIALLCACRADAFSIDAHFAVNAPAARNHRYALTAAVCCAARTLTPAVAAHFAVRTIHTGDCLVGTVSSAFRFSHWIKGFILASEVVRVSRLGLYPSCEDPPARGTVWPII